MLNNELRFNKRLYTISQSKSAKNSEYERPSLLEHLNRESCRYRKCGWILTNRSRHSELTLLQTYESPHCLLEIHQESQIWRQIWVSSQIIYSLITSPSLHRSDTNWIVRKGTTVNCEIIAHIFVFCCCFSSDDDFMVYFGQINCIELKNNNYICVHYSILS